LLVVIITKAKQTPLLVMW